MRSSENHTSNYTYISTSNRYQELLNNYDVENESNNENENQRKLPTLTKPIQVKK